uniref:FAD-binding PCMH-type domain-containing protein n=1 Tax=Fagus sylvatica TaxID=28930 RepID=A0A2N9JB54_FAGSY
MRGMRRRALTAGDEGAREREKRGGEAVEINLEDETARVQSGATLGELYYSIAKESGIHGFPAGICPAVGVGGHFSGGGFGTLLRKYGLSVDNVLDAYLIDVNGNIADREAMGEDLFWAIRGGGGASFGIILSWKIKLCIANKLHEDLFIRIIIQDVGNGNQKTVQASFNSIYLGGVERLIPLMNESFPELGLQAQDCTNKKGNTSYLEARVWGVKYFKGNFKRLAQVKSEVDPDNFFRNEQSIPPLPAST